MDYFLVLKALIVKFKVYFVAFLAAIFSAVVRAANMKRKGKFPGWFDFFAYILMTIVVTFICGGIILYLNYDTSDGMLMFYFAIMVAIGQSTDLIYLKINKAISNLLDQLNTKIKQK